MPKLLAIDGAGERLDRFELIAELASGGMATVYLARLSGVAGFQRLVAIKQLHPHLAKEAEFVEMFLDEARLAARIHHPNVVPIQEVGESKSGYYLVMDYVEGDTLGRVLTRAVQAELPIPWGVTVRILLDTLAGLHAAHELTDDLGEPLSIVHRDVSPQNILVGADGITRITDFGVARAAARLAITRSGQLKGKLAYMAPEQARGDDIDRRADLFSCGIVLWEALALSRLFRGEGGEASTLNRVLNEPIPLPSELRADVPRELEAVCMRALERDIDKRYPTADAFADELERVARGLACVGAGRDVATYLEQLFGAELSQQREALRGWLARSEPSGIPPRSRRAAESLSTRVEGSKPDTPAVDRQAVTAPSPSAPEHVSSVASAVVHVSEADASGLRPRRAAALVVPAAVLLAVAGAAVWGAHSLSEEPAAPTSAGEPARTDQPRAADPAPTASPEPPWAASAAADADGAPGADADRARPAPSAPARERPAPAAKPSPKKPSPTPAPKPSTRPAGPPDLVDDLSTNPYR